MWFVVPGHYGCLRAFKHESFFCGRYFEIRVYETCLLDQIHVSDVPSWVWCCIYYVFHFTPHPVPVSQIDRYQNVTVKVHWEINLAEPCSSGMFICMKNGNKKNTIWKFLCPESDLGIIFFFKFHLNSINLEKYYQSTILHFLTICMTCTLKFIHDPGTWWLK